MGESIYQQNLSSNWFGNQSVWFLGTRFVIQILLTDRSSIIFDYT